tara:strand:- start:536 stop:1420 length:885 start_codon:yes stop_codon:yes gene_type:complete
MVFLEGRHNLQAIVFMMFASAFVASTTIIAKILGSDKFGIALNPLQISHSRFLFAFMFIAIIFWTTRSRIKKPNIRLHILRTVSGWVGVSILFGASSLIPVSDAIAINFTNPIFAMLFAIPFLKEKINLHRWFATFITFLGAIILIRPSFNLFEYEPIALISLFGAIILGLEAILIKLLVKLENQIQILFINNAIGLIISSLPIIFIWKEPSVLQIILCLFVGLFMLLGQFCFLEALKRGDVSFVVPFFYNTLIFVIIFDYFIFNDLPDDISLIGSFAIIIGGIINFYGKRKKF